MKQLTLKEKAAYGLGAVGKDMVYMLSASYVLYYYQDLLGVNAVVMGIILMIARVFDAFNDPLMGVLVAKTNTKFGRFRPWLFIGTFFNAIVLFLMFAAPPALKDGGMVAYAAIFYILWGVTYTMMDIPFWSMIPAFTRGGKERESMSALGRTCAGVGSALVTVFTVMAVAALGNAVSSRSADNTTLDLANVTAYIIEMDETGTATGNVLTLDASNVTVSLTAKESELQEAVTYNQSNSDYTVTFDGVEYTQDDSTMSLAVDSAETDNAIALYVSAEEYAKVSETTALTAEVTSTREVERIGFKYFALIIAILFMVFTTVTCLVIKEKSTVNMKTAGIGEMFKALVQNDQAMAMVVTIVMVNSATYITSNLLIYFFKYDLGGTDWNVSYTIFNTFAGGIQILAMMAFFPLLRKFFSTIRIFYICVGSAVFGYIILFFMAFLGVSSVYPFLVPGFFIMAAVGIMNVLVTIFLANTVDYGELKNKRRDESVIFSMQTFVVKLASGVAALVASICLAVFHISESSTTFEAVDGSMVKGLKSFVDSIVANGATTVSGSSVLGLRFVMTVIPIFVLLIAFFVFKKKYTLTADRLEEIEAQVKELHAAQAQTEEA